MAEPVIVQGRVIATPSDPQPGHYQPGHYQPGPCYGPGTDYHGEQGYGQAHGSGPYGSPVPTAYGAPQHAQPPKDDLAVVQPSCKDANLPPELRLGFIKKVYGILGTMLLITFGISTPFIFDTKRTLWFFHRNQWILYVVGFIVLAQVIFDLCMSCQLCCGGSGLLRSYFWMMKTSPWNYLYLMTFSVCFGVLIGFVCAQYTAQSVLLVFALTFVLVVALTIYAVRTKADFTGCGAYIMVLFMGMIMLILVYSLFPSSLVFDKIIAGVGATLFGMIIVYDTQMIFGSASAQFGGGKREIEYTIDMYAFAAWSLYLDFLNFFLYMLQLLGERRD